MWGRVGPLPLEGSGVGSKHFRDMSFFGFALADDGRPFLTQGAGKDSFLAGEIGSMGSRSQYAKLRRWCVQ